jgi:hypothetical protein
MRYSWKKGLAKKGRLSALKGIPFVSIIVEDVQKPLSNP